MFVHQNRLELSLILKFLPNKSIQNAINSIQENIFHELFQCSRGVLLVSKRIPLENNKRRDPE